MKNIYVSILLFTFAFTRPVMADDREDAQNCLAEQKQSINTIREQRKSIRTRMRNFEKYLKENHKKDLISRRNSLNVTNREMRSKLIMIRIYEKGLDKNAYTPAQVLSFCDTLDSEIASWSQKHDTEESALSTFENLDEVQNQEVEEKPVD